MSPHTVCNLWVIWFIGTLCFLDRQTLVWLPKSRWHQRPIRISPFYIIDYIDYILRHRVVERACQMSVASDVVVWLFLGESDSVRWVHLNFNWLHRLVDPVEMMAGPGRGRYHHRLKLRRARMVMVSLVSLEKVVESTVFRKDMIIHLCTNFAIDASSFYKQVHVIFINL